MEREPIELESLSEELAVAGTEGVARSEERRVGKGGRSRRGGARWSGGQDAQGTGLFFFQAEDGIRDYKVTGVQTCALPICRCAMAHSVKHLTHAVPYREDSPSGKGN